MRRCKKCGELTPADAFYKNTGGRDGLRPECKSCTSARRKQWYATNREREIERVRQWQQANHERYLAKQAEYRARSERDDRAGHLRRKFAMTVEDYDRMAREQGGACAICSRPPRTGTRLHVDRDHETGRVRGLLCFSCNVAVGQLQHDPSRIVRAADYLEDDAERDRLVAAARSRVRELVRAGSV